MSTHFHALRVKSITPDTDEAVIVSFDVPSALQNDFKFTQGQHLTLRTHLNGKVNSPEVRRSYSICSGVDDGELRIGVRHVAGGVMSSWLNHKLKIGDTLDVLPPEGRFFVPVDPSQARHYLGIAGGSGITPILAIMKTLLDALDTTHCVLPRAHGFAPLQRAFDTSQVGRIFRGIDSTPATGSRFCLRPTWV
jgi:ring-1,2-phenylacetyl-CoA epoxidase subunit PaaE